MGELKDQRSEKRATQKLTTAGSSYYIHRQRGEGRRQQTLGAKAIQQSWDHKEGTVWQNDKGDVATSGDSPQNKREEKYLGFSLLYTLQFSAKSSY